MKEETIKKAASDGVICKVIGHRWTQAPLSVKAVHYTKDENGNIGQVKPLEKRKCDTCGKVEMLMPGKWETHKPEVE